MLFQNRIHAGRRLARALVKYRACHPVVLALPRGGVLVAAEVATALDAPLDLVLVRKIGVPGQPELAMGAVTAKRQPSFAIAKSSNLAVWTSVNLMLSAMRNLPKSSVAASDISAIEPAQK